MKSIIFIFILNYLTFINGLNDQEDPNFHKIEEPPKINVINCLEVPQLCSPQATCIPQTDNDSPIGKCTCNSGFQGDGILCMPKPIEIPIQKDECTNDTDCSLYGRCIQESINDIKNPIGSLPEFNSNSNALFTGRRVCGCMQGYVRVNNSSCVNENDAPCNLVPNCHQNANCKYNVLNSQFECECNDNYKGNGKHCEPIIEQCNQLNNCDEKAQCVFNYQIREYQCVCLPGYFGDGYFCRSRASCKSNSSLCHQNADCVFNNRIREYECVCSFNYLL